jgi:hypothetical protein
MMALFICALFGLAFAEAPSHWSSAFIISEKHEFYAEDKIIEKPLDSWQILFALVFPDAQLNLQKDCVLFRVPGNDPGELKIKRLPEQVPCETVLFSPGDQEWKEVKDLQYSIRDHILRLSFTLPKLKSESWKVSFLNLNSHPRPEINMSSAEFKSPRAIMLAPGTLFKDIKQGFNLKEGDLCHEVSDDCVAGSSRCLDCPAGWVEFPNGCAQGPKKCGSLECGGKNAPACRKGMRWQRDNRKFSCSEDRSFAYCSPGLKLECEGPMVICR